MHKNNLSFRNMRNIPGELDYTYIIEGYKADAGIIWGTILVAVITASITLYAINHMKKVDNNFKQDFKVQELKNNRISPTTTTGLMIQETIRQ